MIVSVTVLGSSDGTAPAAVGRRVVDYLEGGRVEAAGRRPGRLVELPAPEGGVVAYYADSAGVRAPLWHGARTGRVDASELATLLAGVEPRTGEPLIAASGSARRAERVRRREVTSADLEQAEYSTKEAAAILGVSSSYLRRLLQRTAEAGGEEAEGIARQESGWLLTRDALIRIGESRRAPRVVAGYDLTFSVPKSVSVLWAGGDEATRAAVLDALDESVAAGLRYLERHAIAVRVRGVPARAHGWIAGDYLHTTSRALEPQLHHHVVVVNAATGPDGVRRALDGRLFFHHAKTAAHLAGAAARHQLSARLGLRWGEPIRGAAEILGIPETALREMSTRRAEIEAAVAAVGLASPAARQVAALDTRAPKQHGVDPDELLRSWDERLTAAGYGPGERAAVLGQVDAPGLFGEHEREAVFASLVRVDGLTENEAVFDRRRVLERLAELAGDRLSADAIDALGDELLARSELVELIPRREHSSRDGIRRRDGRVVVVPGQRLYTSESMLALEQRALATYGRGREAGVGVVPDALRQQVLAEERFARLSAEQRSFVEALTSSGMRIQAGVGAAGSGKTTALEAAVAAWHAAGYRVVGAAVGGTQALVLGEETGIEARTVASVLARYFDRGELESIGDRTVLLVDEASLVSTVDFAALARIAEERGAVLRLVGDPAQHGAVRAGGIFRHLVAEHAAEVPTLTYLYRQQGEAMAEVRLANAEYREGRFADALERLRRDGRIVEAESAEEAYDLLVSAWYLERERQREDPTRRRSAMTAERHAERTELNARARALLAADGTLVGRELSIGELSFRAGDEVIARVADRKLRPDEASRDRHVRNGTLGRVAEVGDSSLVVDFERVGRVTVPLEYLERRLSPGVSGGLQHAYCLTTHAAQGETYAQATPLVTDTASPEGVYVGITRGQFDLRAVAIRQRELLRTDDADQGLPVLEDETGALRAAERHLEGSNGDLLASELRPLRGGVEARSSNAEFKDPRDAELVRSARSAARAVRSARADLQRYERDLRRRERIVDSHPGYRGRFQPADDAARVRIADLTSSLPGLEAAERLLEQQLRERGIDPAFLHRQPASRPPDDDGYLPVEEQARLVGQQRGAVLRP